MIATWNTPMDDYLKEHPEATLKEYVDKVHNDEVQMQLKEQERKKNEKEWIESKVGKPFYINFNGNSKIYFRLNIKSAFGRDRQLVGEPCYSKFVNSETVKFEIEKLRQLNPLWFGNPYTRNNDTHSKITELTEEQFSLIEGIFKTIKSEHDSIESIVEGSI